MIRNPEDWKNSIFSDPDVVDESNNLRNAISSTLIKEFKKQFNILLYLIENEMSFTNFFTLDG